MLPMCVLSYIWDTCLLSHAGTLLMLNSVYHWQPCTCRTNLAQSAQAPACPSNCCEAARPLQANAAAASCLSTDPNCVVCTTPGVCSICKAVRSHKVAKQMRSVAINVSRQRTFSGVAGACMHAHSSIIGTCHWSKSTHADFTEMHKAVAGSPIKQRVTRRSRQAPAVCAPLAATAPTSHCMQRASHARAPRRAL